jgi:hypothetical protein
MGGGLSLAFVVAHPDDDAYGIAGTVAPHASDPRFRFILIHATDGGQRPLGLQQASSTPCGVPPNGAEPTRPKHPGKVVSPKVGAMDRRGRGRLRAWRLRCRSHRRDLAIASWGLAHRGLPFPR